MKIHGLIAAKKWYTKSEVVDIKVPRRENAYDEKSRVTMAELADRMPVSQLNLLPTTTFEIRIPR